MKNTVNYIIFLLFTLLFIVWNTNIQAQCGGTVFINEVGNPSVLFGGEFIELVVVGDPMNPTAPVNLEGWIVDDNNAGAAGVGNEPGHIKLGSCFSQVTPGTIILIYDDGFGYTLPLTGISISNDGNIGSVLQVPFSDPCILKIEGCPDQENTQYCNDSPLSEAEYDDLTSRSKRYIWDRFIPMRNLGDVVQVRTPGGELVHAISWVDDFPGNNSSSTISISELGRDMSFQFSGNTNWLDNSAYEMVADGGGYSPGQPNSPENEAFIASISNGVFGGVSISSDDATSENHNDGAVHLNVTGGHLPMYAEIASGSVSMEIEIPSYGVYTFENLPSGDYLVWIEDDLGCVFEISVTVAAHNTCDDCPADFVWIPGSNTLSFFTPWQPDWDELLPVIYYIDQQGNSYGPYEFETDFEDNWRINGFPEELFPIDGGTFSIGGEVLCNYNGSTVSDCQWRDSESCICPYFDPTQGNATNIYFDFKDDILPYEFNDPVEVTLNWDQNVSGPFPVNWFYVLDLTSGELVDPSWRIEIDQNAPSPYSNSSFPPFTGRLTMTGENDENTCIYSNGMVVDCDLGICSSIDDCKTTLENMILNNVSSSCLQWETQCNTTSNIHRFGKVSIGGVVPPNGYNLAVVDGIMTDFIKIELCGTGGWCDYVFSDGYELKSLPEVEAYIKENKHLSGIPSENEIIKEGGIKVKNIMLGQQEKIEEVFLYMIQLEEDLKAFEKEISIIEKENNFLKLTNGF